MISSRLSNVSTSFESNIAPATQYETAGAILDSNDVETLLKRDDIKYLSEMMNFPGVLCNDAEVLKK